MAQHMISKQSDESFSILDGSTVVDEGFETLQEAQAALDELENDDSEEADDNRSRNLLVAVAASGATPIQFVRHQCRSSGIKRAFSGECEFDRKHQAKILALAITPNEVSWGFKLRERLHRLIHHH